MLGLITNRSDHAVDNLQIRVSLMDSAGKLLGQQDVPPALRHLDVADVSPYAATFPVQAASGMRASAELVQYRPTRRANTPIQSETVRIVQLPDGDWAVLGRLTNPGTSSVAVRELAVLAVDAQGRPTGLLPWTAGPGRIPPRGSQPFLAIGPAGEATKAHIGYARAEPESGARRVDLKFTSGPELRQTSQGELYITGALENLSPVPVWGRSTVLFHVDDQLVGLGQVRFPLPMPPGEVRPFSIRLGPLFGVIPAELDPAGISLSGEPESLAATAAEAALVPLDLEIESFEFTGSRAFVRGRVTNPSGHSTATPTVFAAVRSTEGNILGAAWQVVATRLPASATQPFSLSIDLPAQVNPAMAEYDLRALGTEVER